MRDEKQWQEEKKLVEECLTGNRGAQKKLFKKYYSMMMGISLRYASHYDEAKDLVQEAFIKIFNNLSHFKFEGSLASWIRRIMVNTAIDHYRKKNIKPDHTELSENLQVEISEDVVSTLTHQEMLACLSRLPDGYRTVFNLYVIEGYTHKDIAKMLNISEGTSKSQLFKAKKSLIEIMKKEFGANE